MGSWGRTVEIARRQAETGAHRNDDPRRPILQKSFPAGSGSPRTPCPADRAIGKEMRHMGIALVHDADG